MLIEDYPGRRQDGAGTGAGAVDRRRAGARPVHRRPAAGRPRRHERLRPARRPLRVPAGTGVRERRARRRDQPCLAEDAVRPARVHAGAAGDRRRARRTSWRARSWCSRRRTRSSTRAPTRCPKPSSTASWCASRSATRRPTRRPRCCSTTPLATACSSLEPVADLADVLAAQAVAGRDARQRAAARATSSRCSSRPAPTRALELGASPRAGLMLFRAAKAHAALEGRDHVLPDDVQRLAPAGARPPADARARRAAASTAPRSSPTRSSASPAL